MLMVPVLLQTAHSKQHKTVSIIMIYQLYILYLLSITVLNNIVLTLAQLLANRSIARLNNRNILLFVLLFSHFVQFLEMLLMTLLLQYP